MKEIVNVVVKDYKQTVVYDYDFFSCTSTESFSALLNRMGKNGWFFHSTINGSHLFGRLHILESSCIQEVS